MRVLLDEEDRLRIGDIVILCFLGGKATGTVMSTCRDVMELKDHVWIRMSGSTVGSVLIEEYNTEVRLVDDPERQARRDAYFAAHPRY